MSFHFHNGQTLTIAGDCHERAIELALAQLGEDLAYVLDARFDWCHESVSADLLLRHDPSLKHAESWRIEVTDKQVHLIYADALGAVYGIYHISHQWLGFDPLWFWKQIRPAKQQKITIQKQTLQSTQAVFTYRGWFLNDEDLLCQWVDGGGERELDYPHYQFVTALSVMKRVYEALLRVGGNLIIPGSFVNVMNPAEARLVTHAVEHGLYVSQHHIEPLGVTAFSFETYWEKRGQKHAFEYAKNPEPIRQTWRDYARKWWELAGEQTIWQLGLRGRGDRPIWDYDPTVTQESAGRYISQAMHDQWQIVRKIDSRPTPAATTTLWHEGAQLMAQGQLDIPKPVTIIFSDKGQTQAMQEDFHTLPRDTTRTYGAYYHAGFWIYGSHLVQGTQLGKMQREVHAMIDKGDTHYAILNTANIREHVLPIAAFARMLHDGKRWDMDAFMTQWAPLEVQRLYKRFLDAIIPLDEERSIQDGYIWLMCQQLLLFMQGKRADVKHLCLWPDDDYGGLHDALHKASFELKQIVSDFPALTDLPDDVRLFYQHNVREQARMLGTMYHIAEVFMDAIHQPALLSDVIALIDTMLNDRQVMAQGPWENWYRGETKECWQTLRQELWTLAEPARNPLP